MNPLLSMLRVSLPALLASALHASLTDSLVAYYDFEETGEAGLANKAPGATGYHAAQYFTDGTASFDPNYIDPDGPGFAGKANFNGGNGLSDRSKLLAGKALNLTDAWNQAIVVPLGTAELGHTFTISAWYALTPGDANNSDRYHVFESSNDYDVSWGTGVAPDGPHASYDYLGYIVGAATNSAAAITASGVSTSAWHHVAHVVTTDGADTTLTVYLDGKLVGSLTRPTVNTDTTPPQSMDIGFLLFGRQRTSSLSGTGHAGDRYWDGMMDEIAIWDRALTAQEIHELRMRGLSGTDILDSGFEEDLDDDDNDGLANFHELWIHGTDPDNADTDGDGIPDGDELHHTRTDPLENDSALVNGIKDALCGGPTGDVAFSSPALTRDPVTGELLFRFRFEGDPDGSGWSVIPLDHPGTLVAPAGDGIEITIPAPSDTVPIYRLRARRP